MADSSEPTLHRADIPFFHRRQTHEVIEYLAGARKSQGGVQLPRRAVTIFAGAGVTKDSGTPTWDELVARLIERRLGATDVRPTKDEITALRTAVSNVLQAYGPLAAASAVMELYYEEREGRVSREKMMPYIVDDIAQLIYQRGTWAPDGALAAAIVRFAVFMKSHGGDVAIITTNYDANLEAYAGDSNLAHYAKDRGIRLLPLTDDEPTDPGEIPIYHLHGYVPYREEPVGNFAFSEAGLHRGHEIVGDAPKKLDWRAAVLKRRLEESNVIFVGTTLRDPTVVNSLLNTKEKQFENRAGATDEVPMHYGIFPAQADSLNTGADLAAFTARLLTSRLRHLGVELVRPDFFGQIPQFFDEILHCYHSSSTYTGESGREHRYGHRVNAWWEEWEKAASPHAWDSEARVVCQRELLIAKDKIKDLASDGDHESEAVKLEIWVRMEPESRSLALWGTSEQINRSNEPAHRCDIEAGSEYVAVRTFCKGNASSEDLDRTTATRRWKSFYSVPIKLAVAPWHGIPVGVLNLMSAATSDAGIISRLSNNKKEFEARDVMLDAGRSILDPARLQRLLAESLEE